MTQYTRKLGRRVVFVVAAVAATAVFIEYAGRAFVASPYDRGAMPERPVAETTTIAASVPQSPRFAMHDIPRALPGIRFSDGAGGGRSFADFRDKVVLLNVWATWCAPCRKEMPALDRLQMKLGGSDFEVVALSIDRAGIDVIRKFYGETKIMRLAVYIDTSGKAARDLGIAGIPATLLIDRTGLELGRLIGPAEWDSAEMVAFLKSTIVERRGALAPAGDPGPHPKRRMEDPSSAGSDVPELAKFRTPLNGDSQ